MVTALPSGLVKANIKHFVPCNDGLDVAYVTGMDGTQYPIVNYTAAAKSSLRNTSYGPSNFKIKRDLAGTPTATATQGTISGENDGRSIDLPLTPPLNFVVSKDIAKIEGDYAAVLVQYVDTTTQTLS